MSAVLPPMLTVGDVQERYGLHDPRAARQMIAEAGGRKIGNRWMIRADVLDAWETRPALANTTVVDQAFVWSTSRSSVRAPLARDWYKEHVS